MPKKPMLLLFIGALAALGLTTLPAASGAGIVRAATHPTTHAPLSAAQIAAYRNEFGYVPGDPQNYLTLKQQAQNYLYPNGVPTGNAPAAAVSTGPSPSWQGVRNITDAPPDANGAIGPTEYVEVVNRDIAVYRRDGSTIGTQGLQSFVGTDPAAFSATDPTVLWDPGTDRFYYQYLDIGNGADYFTRWGFSKTDSPSANGSDWCQYNADFGYGADLPDYPKMGQTSDFLLIGVNMFPASGTNDSDIDWIGKPQGTAPVTTCPSQGSIAKGVLADGITNADASLGFTPVPAIQTDPSGTGYVVATVDVAAPVPLTQGDSSTNVPGLGSASFVTVYSVTSNGGTPQLSAPHAVTVNSFQTPINATQMSSPFQVDTLDGRLTHAVSGIDPSRGGGVSIWTTHAVMGGAGAEQRWYQIDPSAASLLQPEGVVTSQTAFNYNGAVAPDRAVSNGSARFGGSMALGLTTSGPTANPTDIMVTKVLGGPQSATATVVASPNGYDDFSCSESALGVRTACRWGDYGGATSDPTPVVPSNSQVGNVWLTNEWNVGIPTDPLCSIDACWQTWNWAANLPQPPPVDTPEAPFAALLIGASLIGLLAGGALRRRQRGSTAPA